MHWLLLALGGGFAFVYLTRLFWSDTPKISRSPLVTTAIVVLALTLVLLVVSGRTHWLSAAVAGVIPFLRRATGLLRYAPFLAELFQKRPNQDSAQSAGNGQTTAPELSLAQARAMLEVSEVATAEEIVSAHRRLISRNHPDRGGSTYIAAQLNAAKDLLLGNQQDG